MKTGKTIACAVIGLGLGYALRTAARETSPTGRSAPETHRAPRASVSPDTPPDSHGGSARGLRLRRESEPTFTRGQVDLLLTDPMRFRLTPFVLKEANAEHLPASSSWLGAMTEFFSWDETQRAGAASQLRSFAADIRRIVAETAVIDTSDPANIRIDLGPATDPYRQRLDDFRDQLLADLGAASMARFDSVADTDALARAISQDSLLALKMNAKADSDKNIHLDLALKSDTEEWNVSLTLPESLTLPDGLASEFMNVNFLPNLHPFMPPLDWDPIIAENLKSP